jgi:nicotinamidase-related amidase
MPTAMATPGRTLLSPTDHTLILIDFQSQMAFATKSNDGVVLRNNAALVANAARIFNVSTIPTTVAEKTFSGPMFDEIKAAFPKARFFDRTQHEPLGREGGDRGGEPDWQPAPYRQPDRRARPS